MKEVPTIIEYIKVYGGLLVLAVAIVLGIYVCIKEQMEKGDRG